MTELECCIELGGNGGSDGDANTCYDAMVDGVLSDLPMDDACYYLSTQQPAGGGFSLEGATGFIESIGSFANTIAGIFGLGTNPNRGKDDGNTVNMPPAQQDKQRRNTLLILGLITLVVIGFAAYTLSKKKR